MKCFFWEKGEHRPGIQVLERGRNVVLPLGEMEGGGTKYLRMHNERPPALREKGQRVFVDDAYPVSMRTREETPRTFFVLAKPYPHHADDDRILVQLSTYAKDATKKAKGVWRVIKGSTETIEQGTQSNRSGQQWKVALLRMTPGDVLSVTVEGEGGAEYLLTLEGDTLVTEPVES